MQPKTSYSQCSHSTSRRITSQWIWEGDFVALPRPRHCVQAVELEQSLTMIRASWSVWSGWPKWHYGGCKDAGHASSIGGEINSLRRHPEVRAVFGAPRRMLFWYS